MSGDFVIPVSSLLRFYFVQLLNKLLYFGL